jgi:hypothetical protein
MHITVLNITEHVEVLNMWKTDDTLEKLKTLRSLGFSNRDIAEEMGVSLPTITRWAKEFGLDSKYKELRERSTSLIIGVLDRVGCCTLKDLSEMLEMPPHTIDRYLNLLLRQGEIGKISFHRGRKSRLKHRGVELFGDFSGQVIFFHDKKALISKIAENVSRDNNKGTKAALSHHLKCFGLSSEEIRDINRLRLSTPSRTNLFLKISEIEQISSYESIENGDIGLTFYSQ